MRRGISVIACVAASCLSVFGCALDTQRSATILEDTVPVVDRVGDRQDVRLRIAVRRPDDASRARAAAHAAMIRFTRWFGFPTDRELSVVDDGGALFEADETLALEARIAGTIASHWWGDTIRVTPDPGGAFHDGLTAYLAGFVVEDLFNARFAMPGRTVDHSTFFGGALEWSFPRLRLGRVQSIRRDVSHGRFEQLFVTIERHIGPTAMERALHVAAGRFRDREVTPAMLLETIGAAAGRDLSWLTSQVFDSKRFDYAVHEIAARSVVIRRLGDGIFTGTTQVPQGPYEAGRAVQIGVTFADGQRVMERWDGRAEHRVFEYDAPAPIVAAAVDPDGVIVIDENRLNNVIRVQPDVRVPVERWMVRWISWVQHALLTYSLVL